MRLKLVTRLVVLLVLAVLVSLLLSCLFLAPVLPLRYKNILKSRLKLMI